jgi:hypothetical protein
MVPAKYLVQTTPNTSSGLVTVGMTYTLRSDVKSGASGSFALSQPEGLFTVAPDTRTVFIRRQNATGETSDADGSQHGDTLYSTTYYTTTHDEYGNITGDPGWWTPNWQVYLPMYGGDWGYSAGLDHYGNATNVPNASYSWDPNESLDTWDWGTNESPAGTITYQDGNPQGTPDKPTSQTITYTATSKVDGAQAVANYDITYHDPFEEMSDTKTNVTATGPLYGSDPLTTDNTLDIVWGYQPAGSQAVSKGTSSSQGIDLEGGLDASWLEVLGISFDVTKTNETGSDTSVSVTDQVNLPANEYTYPEFVDTYVRNTVLYRQWGTSGEITVNSTGGDAPATEVFDQYAGSSIFWHTPIPISQPVPVQDPDPIPVVATPAAGS